MTGGAAAAAEKEAVRRLADEVRARQREQEASAQPRVRGIRFVRAADLDEDRQLPALGNGLDELHDRALHDFDHSIADEEEESALHAPTLE